MTVQTKAPDSQFAYVVLAARRARQISRRASPLVENPRTLKPTRVACEEVNGGDRIRLQPGKIRGRRQGRRQATQVRAS
jgi:DNA-directed RNA polymerase omega subunit